MKRVFLFLIVNLFVIITISIVTSLLGLDHYLEETGLNYGSLFIFCLLWGVIGSFVSLQFTRWTAKRIYGVKPLSEDDALAQRVYRFARQAKMTVMPEVCVYESPEVNAFATGPSRNRSIVMVSRGLLNNMSEREADAVLAHEISHIVNGDMVTMALLQGVVNAFVMFIARAIAHTIMRGDDDNGGRSSGLGYFIVVMALQVIVGFFAMPIVYWFSRYREYRADFGAANLVGKEQMISALSFLQNYGQTELAIASASNEKSLNSFKIFGIGKNIQLFSTHPPLEKRIKALKAL